MPALSSHLNVWNTCLLILRERGWKLRLEGDEESDLTECTWSAEKNGYDFWADNPIELLGLVAVYDYHQAPTEKPESYW